jgi:hypothetical protein
MKLTIIRILTAAGLVAMANAAHASQLLKLLGYGG